MIHCSARPFGCHKVIDYHQELKHCHLIKFRLGEETQGSDTDLTGSAKETPPTTPSTIVASLDKSILQVLTESSSTYCKSTHIDHYSIFQLRKKNV